MRLRKRLQTVNSSSENLRRIAAIRQVMNKQTKPGIRRTTMMSRSARLGRTTPITTPYLCSLLFFSFDRGAGVSGSDSSTGGSGASLASLDSRHFTTGFSLSFSDTMIAPRRGRNVN